MIRLTILHNIHLNKDKRYRIYQGEDIETVGVSVPCWSFNKKKYNPNVEIFCKYYLKNPKKEVPVKILDDGYEITLPYRTGTKLEISNEEWRDLSLNNPDLLEEMYSKTISEVSAKNLLNIKDGGSEFLSYKELNQIKIKNKKIQIMHNINISTIKKLEESIN